MRIKPRASAVRCFWPPERVTPRSPSIVSRPSGKFSMVSLSAAASADRQIS